MTVIMSFLASDGSVFCADTEETIADVAKRNTRKIATMKSSSLQLLMGGSGDGPWIDSLTRTLLSKIIKGHMNVPIVRWDVLEKVIRENVEEFYEKYIKGYADDPKSRPTADLLILANGTSGRQLVNVYQNTVNIGEMYDTIGAGAYVAKDFADRLWRPSLTMRQSASLAIYIMERVKTSVPGCGGNTDIAMLSNDGQLERIPTKRVKELEVIHADIEMRSFDAMVQEIIQHAP